jgi:hypothetical protein
MFESEGAEEGVRSALEAYPDDPSGLKDREACDGFAQLQRISEMVEAKRLQWLADQERRASYRRDEYLSSAAWLADRFGVAAGAAKQQVQVAQALEEMPRVRDSFLEGSVTSGAVRVLAAAREASPEAFASDETALVEAAMRRPIEELRRIVGEWSQAIDERDALERTEALRRRRRLNVCPIRTGWFGWRENSTPKAARQCSRPFRLWWMPISEQVEERTYGLPHSDEPMLFVSWLSGSFSLKSSQQWPVSDHMSP